MNTKELLIPFGAPLKEQDTETQTFGCRANNPDICGNNGLPGVCAFVCTVIAFVGSRHVHGKSNTRSSRVKPLNYRLLKQEKQEDEKNI